MAIASAVHNQPFATFAETAQEKTTQVENYWKLYDQGIFLLHSRQYQAALQRFEQLIAIASLQPEVWYVRGDALANLTDYSAALASFDRSLELDPTQPETWVFRGVVLIHLKRDADAVTSCDQALKLQPDHEEAWLFRAVALQRLGHYQKAYMSFKKVFEARREPRGEKVFGMTESLFEKEFLNRWALDKEKINDEN